MKCSNHGVNKINTFDDLLHVMLIIAALKGYCTLSEFEIVKF